MRLALRSIFIVVFLTIAGAAIAGSFEDGEAARERRDYATALQLWRPLADQGNALAQLGVGFMYDAGQGVPQDYAEAMKWIRKAADQGNAMAQAQLGYRYATGQGVPQDDAEAMKWLRKAADQGNAMAQFQLGYMYGTGQGVPQDYILAHMWFNLAAAKGSGDSLKNRDLVAREMTPTEIAEAQRLAREWKPK